MGCIQKKATVGLSWTPLVNRNLKKCVPAPHLHDSSLLKEVVTVNVQKAHAHLSGYRIHGSSYFGGADVHTCMCYNLLMYTSKGKYYQFRIFRSQS
ncbi:hypothetical protein AV530_017057 [Patagioenas fasciata monilis]|uniref:Uncharacterized protein n=1 Tax=Patagioenas fasciata monilis TaxID=372326 RepID=A0A1V4J533_PATFA|nr:hypothetical protein AV530_017057 [Patagioenas fasciata monilis]